MNSSIQSRRMRWRLLLPRPLGVSIAAAFSWPEPMSRSTVSRESLSAFATSFTVSQSSSDRARSARKAARCSSM